MKLNRRNHYRVLHVQPEAPFEVIRASYRTLMGTLKMHPDLGGDHATAALINAAWDVLSDPARRAAYDRSLRLAAMRASAGSPAGKAPAGPQAFQTRPAPRAGDGAGLACPFCGLGLQGAMAAQIRCRQCQSPLGLAPQPVPTARELLGRRKATRYDKVQPLTVYPAWQGGPVPARLRDLSLTGARFDLACSVQPGQVLRLINQDFEALVQVVSVRRQGEQWLVGSRLASAFFPKKKGVFVSEHA